MYVLNLVLNTSITVILEAKDDSEAPISEENKSHFFLRKRKTRAKQEQESEQEKEDDDNNMEQEQGTVLQDGHLYMYMYMLLIVYWLWLHSCHLHVHVHVHAHDLYYTCRILFHILSVLGAGAETNTCTWLFEYQK